MRLQEAGLTRRPLTEAALADRTIAQHQPLIRVERVRHDRLVVETEQELLLGGIPIRAVMPVSPAAPQPALIGRLPDLIASREHFDESTDRRLVDNPWRVIAYVKASANSTVRAGGEPGQLWARGVGRLPRPGDALGRGPDPMGGEHRAEGGVPDFRHVTVETMATGVDGARRSGRLGSRAGALVPGRGSGMTPQALGLVIHGRGLDILVRVMAGHATERVATFGVAS